MPDEPSSKVGEDDPSVVEGVNLNWPCIAKGLDVSHLAKVRTYGRKK